MFTLSSPTSHTIETGLAVGVKNVVSKPFHQHKSKTHRAAFAACSADCAFGLMIGNLYCIGLMTGDFWLETTFAANVAAANHCLAAATKPWCALYYLAFLATWRLKIFAFAFS